MSPASANPTPTIVVIDSLLGKTQVEKMKKAARHEEVCSLVRLFLSSEFKTRFPGSAQPGLAIANILGSSPPCPQQPNLEDCGVYLIGNFKAFFTTFSLEYKMEDMMSRQKIVNIITKMTTMQDKKKLLMLPNIKLGPSSISYTMSREILHKLGPNSLFDSHCHLDFILFWRSPHMESFDQFVHTYPLMEHPGLEGFITNFCSPKLWLQHLVSPSPLIHSLLSRPSVHYTIGCHPHYTREMLSYHNYMKMEKLIQEAGSSCVAVGECGLDTSGKNSVRMSDQLIVFKKQVKLAIRLKKPLVLHIRGAEDEALRALEEVNLPSDWPIHRYN